MYRGIFMDEQEIVVEEKKEEKHKEKLPFKFILISLIITVVISAISCFVAIKIAKGVGSKGQVVINQIIDSNYVDYTDQSDLTKVIEQVAPTVVEVYTEKTVYGTFYGSYISEGAGSGVIISEDGYIVTNNHVIEGANNITVKSNKGDRYDATLIASDQQADIAVIKIDAKNLQAATFGTSKNLKVGQKCFAIGNPLGTLGGTVTDGIISALSRDVQVEGTYMTLLQTNTAISPGNSGGGLFDINGNLIGIINAKMSSDAVEGISFAIPIDEAMKVIEELITNGYVTGRATIGISAVSIDSIQIAWYYNVTDYGVYVAEVTGENAKAAGLKEKDLIIMIDNIDIESFADLSNALTKYSAGDEVTLTVLRERKEITIKTVLEQRTKE